MPSFAYLEVIWLKCLQCGREITSEKIWFIHQEECKEKNTDYESMTFQELKALATERGMKYFRSTSKNELIELLKKGVGNNDLGRS